MSANVGIYTPEQDSMLNETLNVRLNMMRDMVKEGTPSRGGDVRVVKELADSIDTSLHTRKANELKHEATVNNEQVLELVAATFFKANEAKNNITGPQTTALPDELKAIEVVAGETDISPGELDMEDFTKKVNK